MEAQLGETRAAALWDIAEAARAQVRDFCAAHAPEASYRPGAAYGIYDKTDLAGLRAEAEHLERRYGYRTEVLGQRGFAELGEIATLPRRHGRPRRRACSALGLCPRARPRG